MATSGSTDWTLNRSQVITGALRKLAVLPSGGTPSAAQLSDGADALNALIKAFHADGMPVWKISSKTFTVTSGTATYAVGPAQTVSTVGTPLKVLQAFYTPSGGENTPLNVYTRYDFKDLPSSSTGVPVNLYYQPGYLYGSINLWPTPDNSTTTVTIEYQSPYEDMDSSTDNLDFPSYWVMALIYNLAWALSPEYGIPPTDRGLLASEAKFWKSEALSYGSEEGSLFFQPDGTR